MNGMLIVPLQAEGTQLVVYAEQGGRVRASVHLGDYPAGKSIGFVSVERSRVYVYNPAVANDVDQLHPADRLPSLWFGDFSPNLEWLKLLQVADFLLLEIPLPHPPPGDEKVAEAQA